MKNIKQYDKGWVEALIDGEGSLSLIKQKGKSYKCGYTLKPILNIGNNDIRLLKQAQQIIGGGNICFCKRGIYSFTINSNILRHFLPKINLITKENQRLLLIQALNILSIHAGKKHLRTKYQLSKLNEIHDKIRYLNANCGGKSE